MNSPAKEIKEMARITPKKSGLQMLVVVNPGNSANTCQYDCPYLQFQDSTNQKFNPADLVPISIDAINPTILVDNYHPKLSTRYINDLKIWIMKNCQVLLDYWDDKIYEDELIERIQPL